MHRMVNIIAALGILFSGAIMAESAGAVDSNTFQFVCTSEPNQVLLKNVNESVTWSQPWRTDPWNATNIQTGSLAYGEDILLTLTGTYDAIYVYSGGGSTPTDTFTDEECDTDERTVTSITTPTETALTPPPTTGTPTTATPTTTTPNETIVERPFTPSPTPAPETTLPLAEAGTPNRLTTLPATGASHTEKLVWGSVVAIFLGGGFLIGRWWAVRPKDANVRSVEREIKRNLE